MLAFDSFEALTFDCYGTLIDWETGLTRSLAALLDDAPTRPADETLLERFAQFEPAAEAGSFRPYRAVLEDVAARMRAACDLEPDPAAARAFASSVASWPPFADTVGALGALEARYRLAIVSNVDDDLFAASARILQTTFSEVVTAQQVRSYKPAPEHFREVLRRLGLSTDRVLHVAQSLYHDIEPASALGIATVWVNRRHGREGQGATPPARARPDLEVPDLRSLVDLMGLA